MPQLAWNQDNYRPGSESGISLGYSLELRRMDEAQPLLYATSGFSGAEAGTSASLREMFTIPLE